MYFVCSEQVQVSESESLVTSKRSKTKKQAPIDIDFTKSLDTEMPDIFSLPKNPKSLLLPANRSPCNTILPEDCHYQPEDLVKLFLLPNVLVWSDVWCIFRLLWMFGSLFSLYWHLSCGCMMLNCYFVCSAWGREENQRVSCRVSL